MNSNLYLTQFWQKVSYVKSFMDDPEEETDKINRDSVIKLS
jgi:hypothetical protein